ncbi:hypothetical protein Tco_1401351 [Tanacetum coccineum]
MLASLVLHGFRGSMKLKHGALSLYVGNGMHAAVEAIGSFDLVLPRYSKETMGYYFYYPLENKIFVAQNAEFFENNLRSARTPPAPDRYGFYVDAEEYELGDLNELPNYKEA